MPVSFTIEERLVHLHLDGDYTPVDIKTTLRELLGSPQLPADALLLMDVTQSTSLSKRSTDDLRDMAEHLATLSVRFSGRLGIAAGSALHYGMMRMAEVYSESSGMQARVFPTVAEATAWLENPPT